MPISNSFTGCISSARHAAGVALASSVVLLSACSWPLFSQNPEKPPVPASKPVAEAAPEPEKKAEPVACADCNNAPAPAANPVNASAVQSQPLAAMPVTTAPEPAPAAAAPAPAPSPTAVAQSSATKSATPHTGKKAVKAAPAAAKSAAALASGFHINVGLFAVPTNASNAYKKLQGANMPAYTQDLKTAKGKLTRVRVGPFGTRAEADAAAEKIHALQLDAVVFEH